MSTEESINSLLSKGDIESLDLVKDGYHYLRELVTNYARKKELVSINYKTDLQSGVRLRPEFHFTNDGLIDKTIYYYETKPVLCVTEYYTYSTKDDETVIQSKKGISSRKKVWEYFFEDETLDDRDTKEGREGRDRVTSKEKIKTYDTDIQGLVVGERRRKNIQVILSQNAGTALIILGVFADETQIKNEMRTVSKQYSSGFTEYEKYGTEDILTEIENDTNFSWLNTYVPTSTDLTNMVTANQISATQSAQLQGALNAYGLSHIQGMTIRQYFIEKLKGNIK